MQGKYSFGASLQPDAFTPMLERALLMDELGFDEVWVPDHLVFLGWDSWCFDAWCVLSGFAVKTKNIRLGTSVSDPYRRHPAVFAQTIGTLDSMSKGRVILGLGAGEAMNLLPYGIPYNNMAGRMRESVEIMKRLWTGDMIDYTGRFYTLEKAFIQTPPVQKPHPPICIAANSPRTRELAGMSGDGWMAEMMSPERYIRDLEDVRKGAEKGGRQVEDMEIIYHAPFSVSRDRDEAWSMVKDLSRGMFLWWPQQLVNYGHEVIQDFDWKRLLIEQDTASKIEENLDKVPEEIAKEITIYGTPEDCIEKIQRYFDAGVTGFAFIMELEDIRKTKEIYEITGNEIIPYFKEET